MSLLLLEGVRKVVQAAREALITYRDNRYEDLVDHVNWQCGALKNVNTSLDIEPVVYYDDQSGFTAIFENFRRYDTLEHPRERLSKRQYQRLVKGRRGVNILGRIDDRQNIRNALQEYERRLIGDVSLILPGSSDKLTLEGLTLVTYNPFLGGEPKLSYDFHGRTDERNAVSVLLWHYAIRFNQFQYQAPPQNVFDHLTEDILTLGYLHLAPDRGLPWQILIDKEQQRLGMGANVGLH